jgi:hypothetical protein
MGRGRGGHAVEVWWGVGSRPRIALNVTEAQSHSRILDGRSRGAHICATPLGRVAGQYPVGMELNCFLETRGSIDLRAAMGSRITDRDTTTLQLRSGASARSESWAPSRDIRWFPCGEDRRWIVGFIVRRARLRPTLRKFPSLVFRCGFHG